MAAEMERLKTLYEAQNIKLQEQNNKYETGRAGSCQAYGSHDYDRETTKKVIFWFSLSFLLISH
jgi:hypothetical protein